MIFDDWKEYNTLSIPADEEFKAILCMNSLVNSGNPINNEWGILFAKHVDNKWVGNFEFNNAIKIGSCKVFYWCNLPERVISDLNS